MTLEVLNKEEIDRIESEINGQPNLFKERTNIEMQRALNTIKLQRQQLAEQERKVWNEAIKLAERVAYTKLNVGQVLGLNFRALLKPESEASSE